MESLALEVALFTLIFIANTVTNGQIITVPVELHTTVDLPCSCPICPVSTVAVQWYRSSNSDAFIKHGKAIAWWSEGTTGSSQGFGIKDDFSMIIYNLTDQHDQDLYRCIVIPVGGAAQCIHDVKLGIYANPDTSPVIEYIRQTNGFNVTCSISHVFPLTFPILTTNGENGTAYINIDSKYNRDGTLNIDGTYNTTVTQWFPANEKGTTIKCLYSHLNLKFMTSLRIVDGHIIDQPNEEDKMQNNMTHTNFKCTPSGLWIVWIILIIEVLFLIVIVYATKKGLVIFYPDLRKTIGSSTDDIEGDGHHAENGEEEEPVKSKRILLLISKLSFGAATSIIQITIVLIFLVTYIATARCLI